MSSLAPSSNLTIADLPEDVREEGARLQARYHALAQDAGLLNESGAMDLGKLGDIEVVKRIDLTSLRDLVETAEALKKLGGLSPAALQHELVRLGVNAKLERSVGASVAASIQAYAEGSYGFTLNPRTLRFDPTILPRLKLGLETGAVNGLVITAYPTLEQVSAIAANLQMDPEDLLTMPVTEFFFRHFDSRGGKLHDGEEESRLAQLRTMKWPRNGEPIWKAFHEKAAQSGHNIATDYLKAANDTTQAYKDDHAGIYADLDVQPTVQEMLGTVSAVFTNTKEYVSIMNKILGADGVTTLAQGRGLSSIALLQHKVDTLNPVEHLALATAISNPADTSTYPDLNSWVWLGGLGPQLVARANSGSYGLHMSSIGAGEASSNTVRVRSVVR